MCYLPKSAFYTYFAIFMVAYVWIFCIYFYNRLHEQENVKHLISSKKAKYDEHYTKGDELPLALPAALQQTNR